MRLPLQGVGNGRKGIVEPGAVVVTSGDTSVVTLKSVGNTPIPINKVYLDLDGNGEQDPDDFGCRPGERSEDEGALTCSSNRGSGFRLEAFDGAEGVVRRPRDHALSLGWYRSRYFSRTRRVSTPWWLLTGVHRPDRLGSDAQ